jgi:cobalt/nickel transport system permease protein
MHIAEGFLPITHCAFWAACAFPSLWGSLRQLRRPEVRVRRLELAAAGGTLLILTALKLPSVAGSNSHPSGITLGTVLLGPRVMPGLILSVLILHALVLAHGGITTLGANLFSLGVCGPFIAHLLYRTFLRAGLRPSASSGVAASMSSVAVYGMAALQMALAYPDPATGVTGSMAKFLVVYAWTQVPIALVEGVLTSVAHRHLTSAAAADQHEAV